MIYRFFNKIKQKVLFQRIRRLDTKYFATLCDNWENVHNFSSVYFFPYFKDEPTFGHSDGDVPISIALKTVLKGNVPKNNIVLRDFNKEDEKLVKDYIILVKGNSDLICPQD